MYDTKLPGEYVHGDNVFVDDYYMGEEWAPIHDFPDYWVSTRGRIWSDITNSFVYGTPIGKTGHIDVGLRHKGVRFHRYIHRLVAEAFIPNPHGYPIVRHLDDDPSNNCVENLAWGTQTDNMGDAIRNGTFVYFSNEDRERAMVKRRTPVIAVRFKDGEEFRFRSQQEAARELGLRQSDIQRVVAKRSHGTRGYYVTKNDYVDADEFEYAKRHYVEKKRSILATNLRTRESIVFVGMTDAARELGISIASVSLVLSGKMKSARGWYFEFVEKKGAVHHGNH